MEYVDTASGTLSSSQRSRVRQSTAQKSARTQPHEPFPCRSASAVVGSSSPTGTRFFATRLVGMLSEPGCPEKSGLKSIHRTIRQRFSSVSVTPAEGRRTDRTGAPNAGRSGAKVLTLMGFRHTNSTEEDPGGWNGTGRKGPLPPRSASPRRAPRPVLCGLVERVRGADVDVSKRVRQRRELLPPVLREEAGHC